MTKKTPGKAGRPEGAKTKDRAVVTAVITVDKCPKCGCDKPPKNKRLLREGEADVFVQGQPCSHYKHYTATCANPDCGNAFLYREYRAAK